MVDDIEDGSAHKYRCQWQAFRSHRNLIAVILVAEFLGFIPFGALVAVTERHFFSTDKMFFPAMLLWGALYLFTGSRLRNFPCPRCNRNFFGGFFATSKTVLGRNCANCGLRRYADE
jgi:hypothetical protein